MKTVLQLLQIPETRQKITSTLWILIIYRIGFHIPLPAMSPRAISDLTRGADSVFGLLSAFSGSQLGQAVIFALGIMPYISASIIFSVLAKVSPQLEAIQKEGASGQKKINQWTRLAVVPISLLQGLMIWFGFFKDSPLVLESVSPFAAMCTVVLGLMAGALFVI